MRKVESAIWGIVALFVGILFVVLPLGAPAQLVVAWASFTMAGIFLVVCSAILIVISILIPG